MGIALRLPWVGTKSQVTSPLLRWLQSFTAAAYANTRNQHSEDLITRNGYASVLSMLGEYQSALELLPSTEPEYLQDWIGWHIRGIALLRSGKVAEALSTLELGAYKTVSIQRDYFRTALAMARLWQQDWKRAKEQLNRITNTTPIIEQASNIIWLHIHAVDNNQDGVEQSFINLAKNKSSIQLIELTEELRLRYLEKKKGQHNNQWLREREIDILLAA